MASASSSTKSPRRLPREDYVDDSLNDSDAEYSSMMGPEVSEGDIDGSISNTRIGPGDRGRERFRRQSRGHHNDTNEGYADYGSGDGRSASNESVDSFQLYTPEEERSVVRKFDRKLVLFLSLCYLLSFLDRSNIGNARIAGMEEDLQTAPPQEDWYEWSLTSFYISYIAFEWMSLLWRLIPAHIYVSCVILSWGIVASLQAIATSYPILIFLRTLLGIGEAAFTGVPFYLSFFYKRHELAYRTAMFISAAPLATTFASSLAWVILKFGEYGPIAPWRILFLVEGFPSVIVATLAWSIIPDTPGSAPYLTPREKRVARLRLRREKDATNSNKIHNQTTREAKTKSIIAILLTLADYKAWLTALMFFLTNMAYASLPVFLPTIIKEMGYSALQAQALSAPPYLVAFISVYITAQLSDRSQSRGWYVIFHALASAAGYAVLALAKPFELNETVRYAAVYPAAMGFFNVVVLVISWSINNQDSETQRGAGFALLQVVGQCGPILGTRLYPKADAPFFEKGMMVCAGAMVGVSLLAGVLRVVLAWENGRKGRVGGQQDIELEEYLALETREDDGEEEVRLVGSGGRYGDEESHRERRRSRRRAVEREEFRYLL